MALDDVSRCLPRCCKLIPLEVCRVMLPKDYTKKFDLKAEELATPNPTYCASADCATFIRIKEIEADVGTCIECEEQTCVQCKRRAHQGLSPIDPHVQLLMDVAKRSKWQQCAHSRNLVEISYGCYRLVCCCGHAFCYLCGAAWKSCGCPQFGEGYLAAQGPAPPMPHRPALPRPALPRHTHAYKWERINGPDCMHCGAH
jgi:hypothetical protein